MRVAAKSLMLPDRVVLRSVSSYEHEHYSLLRVQLPLQDCN
jgi:hypothetical protein